MSPCEFEVGCRVVCINAAFPEIAYNLCHEIPQIDRVYTVSALEPRATDVVTKRQGLGLYLRELPWPLCDGRMPTWACWRFQRLDDPALLRYDLAEEQVPELTTATCSATSAPIELSSLTA